MILQQLPQLMSDWIAADLVDFLTSDNAEPLNLRSEASEVGGSNRSRILATAIIGHEVHSSSCRRVCSIRREPHELTPLRMHLAQPVHTTG